MKKIIFFRFFTFVFSVLFIVYAYEFPIHKVLAELRYKTYREEKEISDEDIYKISFQKDYKQGGYLIIVIYKEEPECRYEYQYYPIKNKKDGLKIHYMRCDIYNKNNHIIEQVEL